MVAHEKDSLPHFFANNFKIGIKIVQKNDLTKKYKNDASS